MEKRKRKKTPISREKIFHIMLCITYVMALVYLVKNLLGGTFAGAVLIGACIGVFTIVLLFLQRADKNEENKQFVVSIAIIILIFVISLNSGEYYSDDYSLFLTAIAMTGMYFQPDYTITQCILSSVLLVIMYRIHPEKVESQGQFITCLICFMAAGSVFYLAIRRGRAFMEMSRERAEEAENLLASLTAVVEELEKNFKVSSGRIENLKQADNRLEGDTDILKRGSESIAKSVGEVENVCENVKYCIQDAEGRIGALNEGVRKFEEVLSLNRVGMDKMYKQMESVKKTVQETDTVFGMMQQQMQQIQAVTEQLSSIASSTTMLALNASIEAARAGQAGAGFAVVASKVQELAVDSNQCSAQVVNVVKEMQQQVQQTTVQMQESTEAIHMSLEALDGLQHGFEQLNNQFDDLYGDIGEQNRSVGQIEDIFEKLREKILDMNNYSLDNQNSVEDISEALYVYKENINQVIQDNMQMRDLSASMLSSSKREEKKN